MKRVTVDVKNRTAKEIVLTPEEETVVTEEWRANALAAKAYQERKAKEMRFRALKDEILTARAAGETPDPVKVDEFKILRAEI